MSNTLCQKINSSKVKQIKMDINVTYLKNMWFFINVMEFYKYKQGSC